MSMDLFPSIYLKYCYMFNSLVIKKVTFISTKNCTVITINEGLKKDWSWGDILDNLGIFLIYNFWD